MNIRSTLMTAGAAIVLAACAQTSEKVAAAEPAPAPVAEPLPPPPPPGAVAGSTAADRDGDGLVDGYYTADGIYHPNTPVAPPPPPLASRRGERG